MVSRSEIDMKQIKEEYKKNYGKTLYMDILVSCEENDFNFITETQSILYGMYVFLFYLQDDTKGDYEKILLALCGDDS